MGPDPEYMELEATTYECGDGIQSAARKKAQEEPHRVSEQSPSSWDSFGLTWVITVGPGTCLQ